MLVTHITHVRVGAGPAQSSSMPLVAEAGKGGRQPTAKHRHNSLYQGTGCMAAWLHDHLKPRLAAQDFHFVEERRCQLDVYLQQALGHPLLAGELPPLGFRP